MLHLKVLPLVQRVRRCVKFRVETSLQENHLCNAPPSRVEEKRWGPKRYFPWNQQTVSTASTWKLMIFGVHEISFSWTVKTLFHSTDFTNDLQVIFWIQCAIRSSRSIGMVRLLHTQGAGKPFWNDALNVSGSTTLSSWWFFGKGWGMMKTGESWVIVEKLCFWMMSLKKFVLLCWVKGWSLTSC